MKKSIIKFTAKIIFPVMFVGFLVGGCTSQDTNPPTVTTGTPTDSEMTSHTDTMMADNTHVTTIDTANSRLIAGTDSLNTAGSDTALNSKNNKKGKKGKVTILPADIKTNTSAMEMDKEGFYKNTEVLPAFPGGTKALERFFEDNIQYPVTASDNDAE
ncbi:MAG: hypothetical protein WKI04_14515, partial [Ferruginibacter sp.]